MATFTALATSVIAVHPGGPTLQWEISRMDPPSSALPARVDAQTWYGPAALSLAQEGRTVWRRPLSSRMRKSFRVSADEAAKVVRAPDQVWPPLPPYVITDEVVIVLDDDGVLVLRRSDGGVLLDKGLDEPADAQSTYFDQASWTFTADGHTCIGEAAHGRVLARCGRSLAFMTAGHVVLLELEPFRAVVVRKVTPLSSGSRLRVQVNERGMRLSVRGVTYVQ